MITAVVVGSGPNGLAGALTLAEAGCSVRVFERDSRIGGGAKSSALTEPGFLHDDCSAVHPQAIASPFFSQIELQRDVSFVVPPVSYGHPMAPGASALVLPDVGDTADLLPPHDRSRWRSVFARLAEHEDAVTALTMHEVVRLASIRPTTLGFGAAVLRQRFGRTGGFRTDEARSLVIGAAAHLAAPLPSLPAAAGGLALALQAQTTGWPIPIGGSQSIVNALVARLVRLGVTFVTGYEVKDIRSLENPDVYLLDVGPHAVARIVPNLPRAYQRRLERFRYGMGVLKVDYALQEPVPWTDPELSRAGTIHIGGTARDIIAAEGEAWAGRMPPQPFIIASQPTLFDPSRAPAGRHTFWAYAHVPRNSDDLEAADVIDRQVERLAPGFRDLVIARRVRTPRQMEQSNPNYIGGDFTGGALTLDQLLRRPTARAPWRTPIHGVYLCSSSTSPGPGVHGMSGFLAARLALLDHGHIRKRVA